MEKLKSLIIAWASLRVIYLDKLKRHEDSYAVSQEFYDWTASLNDYQQIDKGNILKVPTFNKENRTN